MRYSFESVLVHVLGRLLETDVALSAVVFIFLSEVAEEHPTSAFIIRVCVVDHRMDAVGITLFPILVDFGRNPKAVFLHSFPGVQDERSPFARNIADDLSFRKVQQELIDSFAA